MLHGFVRPKNIPVGYAYEIQKNCEKLHGIDLDIEPMTSQAANVYEWISKRLVDFFNCNGAGLHGDEGGRSLPPIYTIEPDIEKVKNCLADIFLWAGRQMNTPSAFPVYPLHELYFRIAQELPRPTQVIFSRQLAAHSLVADPENVFVEDACLYHERKDCFPECSMTYVRKWCYIIAKHICPYYKVEFVPGRHWRTESGEKNGMHFSEPEFVRLDMTLWSDDGKASSCVEETAWGAPKTRAPPSGHTDVPTAAMDGPPLVQFGTSKLSRDFADGSKLGQAGDRSAALPQPIDFWSGAAFEPAAYSHLGAIAKPADCGDDFWKPSSKTTPPPGFHKNWRPQQTPDTLENNDFPSLGMVKRTGRGGKTRGGMSRGRAPHGVGLSRDFENLSMQ